MIVEICANSFASAKAAFDAGANRIELCTELSVGGLTPSHGLIKKVTSELNIPVHVLIRPRSGNFTYSNEEIDVMLKDIEFCKKLGCDGIVSGVLTSENELDFSATLQLIHASENMEFTFHRAFDWCNKPREIINSLSEMGVTRILSSGQKDKAINGLTFLEELKDLAGDTIQIMPGGGINAQNILAFREAGFEMVHFSATKKLQVLKQPKVKLQSDGFLEKAVVGNSDVTLIKDMIKIIE